MDRWAISLEEKRFMKEKIIAWINEHGSIIVPLNHYCEPEPTTHFYLHCMGVDMPQVFHAVGTATIDEYNQQMVDMGAKPCKCDPECEPEFVYYKYVTD